MIATALLYGAVVGAAFPIGALASRLNPFGHRGYAGVMAFGAGLLLCAALVELAPDAVDSLGLRTALIVVLLAAVSYSLINAWLSQRGAEHRKRCGGCVAPPSESEHSGSGTSIALGTIMDALPEALVLGVGVGTVMGGDAAPVGLIAALFLGNAAQAMSATSGLREGGRSSRFVWGLWVGLALLVIGLTIAAAALASRAPDATAPILMAVAAGVLIALVAEAMLPEASEGGTPMIGVAAALGAALFFALHS